MADKLTDLKERLMRAILHHRRPFGREDALAAIDEAYQLGRESSLTELSAALNQKGAEVVILNAFNLGRGVGREERDAELAAELIGGSSILRDPGAVVDNPAGNPWMEGD